MLNKIAFSLVEIIISMWIIILLWVIWSISIQSYNEKTNNTKVSTDVATIENALIESSKENWFLPMPSWNINFYTTDSTYSHSYTGSETFWVHGSITNNTIAKKYLDIIPIDLRSKSYYAYGKTINTNEFEIWSIQIIKWEPVTKINWNYSANSWLYNLIREYNWPSFIYNNSTRNFPYNPDWLIVSANILDIKWNIKVILESWKEITDPNEIMNISLKNWDQIIVDIGSSAQIFFSDWSTSILWDDELESKLVILDTRYEWDDNLITIIKLWLNTWTIWTKVTHLNKNSEFQVTSQDITAAVRWTIFKAKKDPWKTMEIIVIEWSIAIYIDNIFDKIIYPLCPCIAVPDFFLKENIRSEETIININNDEQLDWFEEIQYTIVVNPTAPTTAPPSAPPTTASSVATTTTASTSRGSMASFSTSWGPNPHTSPPATPPPIFDSWKWCTDCPFWAFYRSWNLLSCWNSDLYKHCTYIEWNPICEEKKWSWFQCDFKLRNWSWKIINP